MVQFLSSLFFATETSSSRFWSKSFIYFSSVVSAQFARYDCFGPEWNRRLKSSSPDEADVDQRRLFSHTWPRADARVLLSVAMRLR